VVGSVVGIRIIDYGWIERVSGAKSTRCKGKLETWIEVLSVKLVGTREYNRAIYQPVSIQIPCNAADEQCC